MWAGRPLWQGGPGHGLRVPEEAWLSLPRDRSGPSANIRDQGGETVPFCYIYIWNLDSSKAAFLCPSQNVQINALCQG